MTARCRLAARAVTRRFGAFTALNNLDIDFGGAAVAAVIGPNGAGKSTLLSILAGSLRPSTGSIIFDGGDLTALAAHDFPRLGIVKSFQITSLFPRLTVFENVLISVQAKRARLNFWSSAWRNRELAEKAEMILALVGLADRAKSFARDLAHGEQRCLDIAIAMAAEPKVMLLDEPTAGMSPNETRSMMLLIEQVSKRCGVILVEHKMNLVMDVCDRLFVLHHGVLLASGTPAEIAANSEVRRVYLGESRL